MITECPQGDQKAAFEAEAQRFARYAENCPTGGFGAALKKAYLQAADEAWAQAAGMDSPAQKEEGLLSDLAPTPVQTLAKKERAEQGETLQFEGSGDRETPVCIIQNGAGQMDREIIGGGRLTSP